MSHLSFFILLFIGLSCFAQKKWDGGGGNSQWSNALNWSGNTVPTTIDDVVLDNSILAPSYSVILPATAVTVRTITITPSASATIDLTLDPANNLVPGLTVTGPGYGLVINRGGIFRNSSGSTSGTTVSVTDSIRINNDGKYIHNSRSGHAANAMIFARIAGTEKGIFELNVPAASTTISFSGRTFGKLSLRSTAAGGVCNYTASGAGRVSIRDNLEIGPGVNFSMNCADTVFVSGDLLQESGTLNLGNLIRSVVLAVAQNITQNTGGIITETGTGTQTILLNGTGSQLVTFKGTISNQVVLVKDGSGVAISKWPVSLPCKLQLRNGRVETAQGLITLQSSCTVEADTLSMSSFIDGPLKKDGLSNQTFLFPVGKSSSMRWLQLTNATGDFSVEYFRSDPKNLSSNNGSGIHHISSIEYWDVVASGTASADLKLSFVHPNSGSITNLSTLRVARLINGTWENAGNAGVSGTPGSDGWVSSNAAGGFSVNSKSFALASAMGLENPLPLSSVKLKVVNNGTSLLFSWSVDQDVDCRKFELQRSYDGSNFTTLCSVSGRYSYVHYVESVGAWFRLKAIAPDETKEYVSNILFVSAAKSRQSSYAVIDAGGRLIKVFKEYPATIQQTLRGYTVELKTGVYYIKEIGRNNVIKYVKW